MKRRKKFLVTIATMCSAASISASVAAPISVYADEAEEVKILENDDIESKDDNELKTESEELTCDTKEEKTNNIDNADKAEEEIKEEAKIESKEDNKEEIEVISLLNVGNNINKAVNQLMINNGNVPGVFNSEPSKGISIDDTFEDETFREYIKTSFDSDDDGYLSETEVGSVKNINVSGKSAITTLKGIEKLTALEKLNCHGTSISELDLTNNTKVTEIDCGECKNLSNMNLTSNSELTTIDCGACPKITSLNFSANKKLKKLNCIYMDNVEEIDLSSNTAFRQLVCNNCKSLKRINISGTDAYYLDYDNCSKIESVDIRGAKVVNYAVSGIGETIYINAGQTAFEAIDDVNLVVDNLTYEYYELDDNNNAVVDMTKVLSEKSLNTLADYTNENYDSTTKKLTVPADKDEVTLSLGTKSEKAITWTFKVIHSYDVKFVDGESGAEITTQRVLKDNCAEEPEKPTKDNLVFTGWYKDNTLTTKFDFTTPITGETTVYARFVDGIELNETNFPDKKFRKYLSDEFDMDKDGVLSRGESGELSEVKMIDIGGEEDDEEAITTLKGIEYFTNLEVLYCSKNNIKELDVSKNTNLRSLYCSDNNLEKLDVSKNINLQFLSCGDNNLTFLDLSNNPKIDELECANCKISDLVLSDDSSLLFVNINKNNISSLDEIKKAKNIQFIICRDNPITEIDLSGMELLYNIDYIGCPVKQVDIRNCFEMVLTSSEKEDQNVIISPGSLRYDGTFTYEEDKEKFIGTDVTMDLEGFYTVNDDGTKTVDMSKVVSDKMLENLSEEQPEGITYDVSTKMLTLPANDTAKLNTKNGRTWTLTTKASDITVSFETNGGSKVEPQTIKAGTTISSPKTTKEGYVLKGWYTDEELTEEFDFNTVINAPTTLYAKWEKEEHTDSTENNTTHTDNADSSDENVSLGSESPSTGDITNNWIWGAAIGAGAIAATTITSRRKNKRD